ncbi:MAG: hypothetical protein IPM85_17370 [Chitinophagaceae bacterium]|nr:hypothetical protein [Chitinophagaceae bacterium]
MLNDYVMKEASKQFFNKTRISGMVRLGYGHFSLYGSYQLPLFKDGSGPGSALLYWPYTKRFIIAVTLFIIKSGSCK